MKVKKIFPDTYTATQWHKHNDIEFVKPIQEKSDAKCLTCGNPMSSHGVLASSAKSLYKDFLICPGDWVLIDNVGNIILCRSEYFADIYEMI